MSLPILNSKSASSPSDLIRLFHKTESLWLEHIAEPEALDVGTAFSNPSLPEVHEANWIRDVALPENLSAQQAFDLVEAHYAVKKVRCYYWTFNPSAPPQRTQPLMDLLLSRGYQPIASDIMHLGHIAPGGVPQVADVKIIPTRASFRHARQLFEEDAQDKTPQLADANMLHLDDPHWDALLALRDGQPLAHIGVLAVGEIGRIESVYVAKAHRGRGLGSLMMSRGLEICARSLFKHVMLSCLPSNTAAIELYSRFGFQKIGQVNNYLLPGIHLP